MTEHRLKTWSDSFQSVWDRVKTYELRKNDRDFQVGDRLLLQEYDPQQMKYSGRWVRAEVGYMTQPGTFPGLEEGNVIMALRILGKGQVSCVG